MSDQPTSVPTSWIVAGGAAFVAAVTSLWAVITSLRKEHTEAIKEKVALLEKLNEQKDKRLEAQDKILAQYAEAAAKEDMTGLLNQQIMVMRAELAAQFNARLQDLKENTSLVTGAVSASENANRKIGDLLSALGTSLSSIHQDLRGIQTSEGGIDQRLDLLAAKLQLVFETMSTLKEEIKKDQKEREREKVAKASGGGAA